MMNAENGQAETARRAEDLKDRTKRFALQIVKLYAALPKTAVGDVLGKQLLRSGTSVGAQYREAARARSTAEFVSKIECCLQELDKTTYRLELLAESKMVASVRLQSLRTEGDELIRILVASARTAKSRH
jgi:four helix bundle protein